MSENSSDLFGSISISPEQKTTQPEPEPKQAPPRKKQTKPPPRQKKTRGRGRIKWLVILILMVSAYSAAGFLLVPYLVKNVLPDYVESRLQVGFLVDKAIFNPFNFNLELHNLELETIAADTPSAQFLTAQTLEVDFDLLSLLRGDLVCSSMSVDGLKMMISREQDKQYNISYLFKGKSPKNQTGIIDFAELPFLFSLNNINIRNSQIVINDKSTSKVHTIDSIELALPAISNFPYQTDSYIHPRFSAVINGSPIKLTGEASVAGVANQDGRETELSCDINDIDLPLYFDYLPVTLPVDISQGKANGKLLISFSPGEEKGSKLNIQFTLATTDLGLVSRNNKLSLAIPSAKFEGSFEPFGRSLVFQNILLREPALVGEEKISKETIANLVPLALRPSPDDPLYQVIPSVFIKLLITDGGSVTIKNPQADKPLGIWHSIQLSVKDFSNTARSPRDPKSSFRLSGEHMSSSAFFTWQGNFDNQNRPGGNLQLNNIPASMVAPFFGRNDKDVSGIADITGLLGISLAAKEDKPLDYILKSTTLTIKDLKLKDQGVEWLAAPSLRCEPVSQIKGVTDLGNIFLRNGSLTINKAKLPYFFEQYSRRPTTHILHGIDFSGTIAITEKGRKKPLINFSNVSFQANRLEQQQQQENNFAFSALVDGKGNLKTKGSLHIAPLQISSQVAFSALSPKQLFTWFTDSQILLSSRAQFSGQGVYRYPQKEYRGDLLAKNVIIHRVDMLTKNVNIGDFKKPALQVASLSFKDFSWSRSAENLIIKQLVVDQPEFSWQRTDQEMNPATSVSIFLRHLILPEPGSKTEDPDIPLSRFSVKIDSIDFTDGALSYLDKRISPPLGLGITGINGTLNNLYYPVTKDDTLISLSGNIEGAPFSLEGSGKLLQLPASARTLFTAPSLPLELFSKQIRKYLREIKLTESTASISATTNLSEKLSEFKSEVTINKIIPEQPGTTTALALALTTDLRGGKTLRIESTETQQNKPVISEVISDFSRLMVKAGINPMLLAGANFKDLVNNQSISFLPGKATMSGESIETLNRYNDFLAAHPLVKLKVIGYADKLNDTQVLLAELAQKEKSRVEAENKRRSIDWKKKLEAERAEAFQQEIDQGKPIEEIDIPVTKPSTFIPETPQKVSVSNLALENLAASREQVVIDYLVKQLDVAVTRVVSQKTSGSRIQNDGKHTRVDFVLSDMYGEQP